MRQLETKIKELEEQLVNVHGTPCEVYSRVVGYHRPVKYWNKGKKEEFKERVTFSIRRGGTGWMKVRE